MKTIAGFELRVNWIGPILLGIGYILGKDNSQLSLTIWVAGMIALSLFNSLLVFLTWYIEKYIEKQDESGRSPD